MNIIGSLNKVIEKYWMPKTVNYILGKRVCSKCAKREWKNEDKKQDVTLELGICQICHKAGMVAYINKTQ